ncbi:hypothetical protein BHE74_00054929 [Ensete ventricosum]|nr:hypothetical protein BHE74_00054929 [Ensete ventricosum]
MRLGTRQECVGSSPRVSGVCQDSARDSNDAVGSLRKFARRFTEGIGKLTRKAKGDRRTCRKITGVCGTRNNHSLPTILIATSNKLNMTVAISHSILLLPSSATAVHIATHLPPIAIASVLQLTPLAATKLQCNHNQRCCCPLFPPLSLLPSNSDILAVIF